MTTRLYPETRPGDDLLRVIANMQEIARIREQEDIPDFDNLPNRFVRGRGRFQERSAPSSPTDVLATDQEGDIVNDATYEYKLLNIPSTGLRWDRRTLDVSW